MGQFLINHWRGRYSPLASLFGILIGPRVLIHLLYSQIPDTLPPAGIALIITADLTLLIWQITGTLRSCERALAGGGDMMLYWGCYGAAVITTLAMLADATSLVSTASIKDTLPTVRKVTLPMDGNTVLIEGDIGFRTHTALLALLGKPERQITTARLSSNGGRIIAARAIAIALIAHDIDTEVDGRCASACTLIFLAGKQRRLLDGAQLGFHQYTQISNIPMLDTAAEQEKDRAYFRSRGVSDAFIERMFQASHRDIWFPDRDELGAAGVVTN